jgi:hypothetical protein
MESFGARLRLLREAHAQRYPEQNHTRHRWAKHTPGVTRLLAEVDEILSRAGIDWWVERARDVGIHPFPDEQTD